MNLNKKTILITGAAGFIGSNLAKRILSEVREVTIICIDNMNDYYDVNLKKERIKPMMNDSRFVFIKGNIHGYYRLDVFFSYGERPYWGRRS